MKRCLLILLCFIPILAGCAASAPPAEAVPEDETVTLDWYINYSWYNTPWGENAVSRAVTEKTGVDIKFVSPDGTESETLNALIAGNNLPDLITLGWWEPQLSEMIDRGMVCPLNELADRYDASFWTVADKQCIDWYRRPDGNVYCYPNSFYTPEDYETNDHIASNQTFLVRSDIYKAIGSPDMTTPDGFADAVRAAAEKFPTVDGKPLIPVGAHEFTSRGCDSFDLFLMNFLAVPYEKDGVSYDRFTDPEYKRWLLMFRSLGEEGLLANDIFIDKRVQMEEKLAEGRYFCMLYQRTDLVEQQRALYEQDPDKVYIAVDGPRNSAGDPHTLPGTSINGWTVTLISKNCKYPDCAIKLMSFLMSEEGQKLTSLGIEGEHYNMKNGRAELTDETETLMRSDYPAYVAQIGADNSYWMLQDNRMQAKWKPLDDPALRQMEEWTYPYTCYTGQYDTVFIPDSNAEAANRRIYAIHSEMLPRLLLAEDEETFEELWQEYITEREEAGLETVLEESTRQMREAKAKLGLS